MTRPDPKVLVEKATAMPTIASICIQTLSMIRP